MKTDNTSPLSADSIAALEPLFTFEQARAVESGANKRGQIRRALLAIGSKSGVELLAAVRETAEEGSDCFIELMSDAADHLEWRKNETEILETCFARLNGALSVVADECEQAEVQQ